METFIAQAIQSLTVNQRPNKMKYTILTLLFSYNLYAKDVFQYVCPIEKNLYVEISLLDQNAPNIDLFYKKSKFANCVYENTLRSRPANPRAQIQDAIWRLQLKACTTYLEAHKDKIKVAREANFKQATGKVPSYLDVVENHQPLTCYPKKR